MRTTRKVKHVEFGVDGYAPIRCVHDTGRVEVWEAIEPRTQRHVAVKLMRRSTRDERKRFDREIAALAALHNAPHVTPLLNSGETRDGLPWFTVPWYDHTLADYLGQVSWRAAARVGVEISQALGAAHAQQIMHRDLKPPNVLVTVTHNGALSPFLADFGAAKVADLVTTSPTGARGTFPFIAPERFTDPGFAGDEKSDVYALAGTLYTLISGRLPLPEGVDADTLSDEQMIHLTITGDRPPRLNVPDPFADLLDRGLRKAPRDRPSLAEFQSSLEVICATGTTTEPSSPTAEAPPPRHSRPPVVDPEPASEPDPVSDPKPKVPLDPRLAVVGAVAIFVALLVTMLILYPMGPWTDRHRTDNQTSLPVATTTTPPMTPEQLAAAQRQTAGQTTAAILNEDPRLRIALFQGSKPGEVCAIGHLDANVLNDAVLTLWQEPNLLVPLSAYDTPIPVPFEIKDGVIYDAGSAPRNQMKDGGTESKCFPQLCADGSLPTTNPGCVTQPVQRIVFQARSGEVLYRTGVEVGETIVPSLPSYADYSRLETAYALGARSNPGPSKYYFPAPEPGAAYTPATIPGGS